MLPKQINGIATLSIDKKCQISNSSWKINVSILYHIPHSCDNTAYPNLLLTSFPRNDLVNCVWLTRVFNLYVPIWGSSLYTLYTLYIKLGRIEFA